MRTRCLLLLALLSVAACGARSSLTGDEPADAGDFDALAPPPPAADASLMDESAQDAPEEAVGAQDAAPDVGPGVPLACDPSYLVDPRALVGCRNPSEPGCDSCCIAGPPGSRCMMLSDEPLSQWDAAPGVERWYNGVSLLPGDCPADCRPCASCLTRDEESLCDLLAHPMACDCTLPPGNDACEVSPSCGCYCENYVGATTACPRR